MWVLNPSSGEIQKKIFANTRSIFDAVKQTTKKTSLAHLALNWALQELPKLMHDATVFLAFYALIKGLQDVPLPQVVNRYENARRALKSAPSGNAMMQDRPKSPLLEFLDALDPRKTEIAPITSLKRSGSLVEGCLGQNLPQEGLIFLAKIKQEEYERR